MVTDTFITYLFRFYIFIYVKILYTDATESRPAAFPGIV